MTEIITNGIKNHNIERNTSGSITVIKPNMDFTGWRFIYLAKEKSTDNDSQAVIPDITPILATLTVADLGLPPEAQQYITGETVQAVIIPFQPKHTKSLQVGEIYEHSCRAILYDENNEVISAITLFNGRLQITQNRIQAP